MSHLVSASLKILDIAALRAAVLEFGGQLTEKKTFTSYEGESNKCDFCIALPGVRYNVGVIKDKAGHYVLSHDPFGYSNSSHDGHKLVNTFGTGLSKLQKSYVAQTVMKQAKLQRGWTVVRKELPNGKLQLRMQHI